jgi:hypothetical protein
LKLLAVAYAIAHREYGLRLPGLPDLPVLPAFPDLSILTQLL